MDKLQPILKHHFWILAFLVLPLAIWGYYTANSSLNAATQAREDALDGVFRDIPPGNSANKTWETEMKSIADQYEQQVDTVVAELHEEQEALMDWPPIMAAGKPDVYRGEWDGDLHFAYKDAYRDLLEDVWRRYQPVVTDVPEGADRSWITWDEKVLIQRDAIQPVHQFGNLRATDEQIWDAQEDIWLHRIIADAVVRTNEDADGPYTTIVKLVQQVELMGGDGKPVAAGGSQGDQNSGSARGMDNYMEGFGGGRGRRSASQSSVAFDPAEEIGGGGRMTSSRGRMPGGGGAGGPPTTSGQTSGGGGSNSETGVLRYVGTGQSGKSNVRAFYMSVIVDQDKFPQFLVELCNSEWPIEIVRFNIGPNPYYASAQGVGRTGVMGGYGGGQGGYGPTGPMGPMGPMSGRPMGIGGRPMSGIPQTSGPMGLPRPMGGSPMGPMGMGVDGMGRQQSHASYGALESPKLVQLDLLGLITIFTPSDKPVVATTTAAVDEADAAAADEELSEFADAADEVDMAEEVSESAEDTATPSADVDADSAGTDPEQTTEIEEEAETFDPAAASESEVIPEFDDGVIGDETTGVE